MTSERWTDLWRTPVVLRHPRPAPKGVPMINLDYPHLLTLFTKHLDPKRSQSASFLTWYLENYYRLDEEKAVYSVCDQRGDKGIDGIFVDDDAESITVFQARISQTSSSTIGDRPLR